MHSKIIRGPDAVVGDEPFPERVVLLEFDRHAVLDLALHRPNSSISAMRAPWYSLPEEIAILGVIDGSLA